MSVCWLHRNHRTNSIFLLAGHLSRGLEIDSKIGKLAFIALNSVFDGVDMERDCESVDGENDRECFAVDQDL